jgi:NADP-dependent 3-hydroxy acid dehydrogenase YdfG
MTQSTIHSRVCIVTGGSNGLGAAMPIGLALAAVGVTGFAYSASSLAAFKLMALTPMETADGLIALRRKEIFRCRH